MAELATKIRGELRYHTQHTNTRIKQLGSATTESKVHLQKSLEYTLSFALSIFQESPYETELINSGIFEGEQKLKDKWLAQIQKIFDQSSLQLPDAKIIQPILGSRAGKHSEHLQRLVNEISKVFNRDPTAE